MNATERQPGAGNQVMAQGRDEYAESRRRGIPKGNGITFPRWLLFPAGVVFFLLGVLGTVSRPAVDNVIPMSGRKAVGYLTFGSLLMWVASTWQVSVRIQATRLLGIALLGNGLKGLTRQKKAKGPWESLFYALLGCAFLAAGYWKRPFDYRD